MGICTGRPEIGLNIRDSAWGQILEQFNAQTVQTLRFETRQQDTAGEFWYAFWWNLDANGQPRYGWVINRYHP